MGELRFEFDVAFNCNQCGCGATDHFVMGNVLLCRRCAPGECASKVAVETRRYELSDEGPAVRVDCDS